MKRFFLCMYSIFLISFLLTAPACATEISWTKATGDAAFPPRANFPAVVFNDKMWIIGGLGEKNHYYNDVWYSTDGIRWNPATESAAFSPRYGHTALVFDNKLWVIGGFDGSHKNDVWYSADGATWTEATSDAAFAPRDVQTSVVYDGRMWVIGGETVEHPSVYTSDVWYSSDGITWIRATAGAPFSPRVGHSSAVLDDKMWIFGGMGDGHGKIRYNDVWYSTDGENWNRKTGSAGFSPRYYFASASDGKNIFVIGGSDGGKTMNDVWSSPDGATWLPGSSGNRFSPRNGFYAVVFNNRIWVVGGIDGTSRVFNDVWYSSELASPAPAGGITITKTVSPWSIKQGTDALVSISFTNGDRHPVHDVEILDPTLPEFPVISGETQAQSSQALMPNESLTYTYTIRASRAGRFTLPGTSALYAGEDGNYHRIVSNSPPVDVIAPLIPPPDSPAGISGLSLDGILHRITSFFSPETQKIN